MSRERAGLRALMAFLAMSGLGTACTPPHQMVEEKPNSPRLEYFVPSSKESYFYLYLPERLGMPAWDVYLDGAYYGYLEEGNQKSPISVKVENETLSIRLERSAFDFQEKFPGGKNLAYILDFEDSSTREMPIEMINKVIDSGGQEIPVKETSTIIPGRGYRLDEGFVYLDFNYPVRGERYWFLIMRSDLFNDKQGSGVAFLRLIHIKRANFY